MIKQTAETADARVLMKGNEAIAESAIRAGLDLFAGYPITPQNQIPEYMSWRMPQAGKTFIQAESELAAINMVFGAAVAGKRAMTTSSSPGISLMQEGISYLAGCELPAVIVNIQRGGPGLGNIQGAQGDYFQSTRGGGHGDYRCIVLAPSTVSEAARLTAEAFDLAEIYRNPVIVLSDGVLGQMMEPMRFEAPPGRQFPVNNWALTGCEGRQPRKIRSLLMAPGALEQHNYHLAEKYRKITEAETRFETVSLDSAEIVLVAQGIASRMAKGALEMAVQKKMKVGMIRPIVVWPFPYQIIRKTAEKAKKFLVVEMNMGQMIEDVRLAVGDKAEVYFTGRPGGALITPEEIFEKIAKITSS